jgi:hypothetical protein
VTTAYIEPGSPWENGYCDGFNSKLRDEPLNGEIFYNLNEAQIVIDAPAFVFGLETTRPAGRATAGCATRTRFARHPDDGARVYYALTFNAGHPTGAGHAGAPLCAQSYMSRFLCRLVLLSAGFLLPRRSQIAPVFFIMPTVPGAPLTRS